MLQNQINPHFIFNTLNLISTKELAEHKCQTPTIRIVTLLSNILRAVLDTKSYLISFGTELQYLKDYIELQNIRLDEIYK